MTPERKAEVNRILWRFLDPVNKGDHIGPDYTADLNCLASLEAKLPRHHWCMFAGEDSNISAELDFYDWRMDYQEPTEAEARAEALARYLERRK